MAPQQRKNGSGKSKDKEKDSKKDDKNKSSEEKKGPFMEKMSLFHAKMAPFMERHILKVQLGLMLVAFMVSVVPRYLAGHDRYRFDDSYKDPVAWHQHFAKEYVNLTSEWGYTLHVNASERLHGLLSHRSEIDIAGARVLDVGAGSGLVGLELRRLGFRHMTGVDVVPEILSEANATGAYEHIVTADVEAVPIDLANASFDAVLCVGSSGYLGRGDRDETGPTIDHSRESKGPLAEAARVERLLQDWLRLLKPGGILGLTAEVLLKSSWEEAFQKFQQDGLLTHLESTGNMSFLPFNGEKWTAGQTVHMYFHQKPK